MGKRSQKKKTSIIDIAKYSGVSVSTVSRVMGNHKNVSADTKKKVDEAIMRLNYTPSVIAQSLAAGSMKNIGVVFTCSAETAFLDPFYGEALRGVGSALAEKDYHLQLIAQSDSKKEKDVCLQLLQSGRVDGLILLRSRVYDSLVYELVQRKFPFVLCGQISEEYPIDGQVYSVDTNNIDGSFQVVEHLIRSGCRKIAMITSGAKYVVDVERFRGYRRALFHYGIEFDEDLVICCDNNHYSYKSDIKKKLKKRPDIDGIFARDDYKAIAALSAIKEMGLKIPDDVSVAGYNDYYLASIVTPQLTTMAVNLLEFGRVSAEMMIDLLEGNPIAQKRVILPITLLKRESTFTETERVTNIEKNSSYHFAYPLG